MRAAVRTRCLDANEDIPYRDFAASHANILLEKKKPQTKKRMKSRS